MPRVITTFSKIKKGKKEGEKTFPFDLAFFNNLGMIIYLIKTKFQDFFENMVYTVQPYENKKIHAIFNHDSELSIDEFTCRYHRRIKDFYECLANTSTHKFFIIASFNPVTEKEFSALNDCLSMYTQPEEFTVVLINQSKIKNTIRHRNLYVIEMKSFCNFWTKINKNEDWVGEFRKRNTFIAIIYYYRIVIKILSIMKKKLKA